MTNSAVGKFIWRISANGGSERIWVPCEETKTSLVDPEELILRVLEKGEPTRVIVEPSDSTAVYPDEAKISYGMVPTIVFIRADGWSIGAPKHLEKYAQSHGRVDGWVAVIRDFQFALKEFQSKGVKMLSPL